jgi:Raf kinase inhibitor-like YbhB/YbcL family protein
MTAMAPQPTTWICRTGLLALLVWAAACGGETTEEERREGSMLTIESPAFEQQGAIPVKHTGDGEDVSPALTFENPPEGTVELALICDDPDAPTPKPWVHWVIYKIPPNADGLAEGYAASGGVLEGKNSWTSGKTIGYRGPLPPSGTHRYFFRLYALDQVLELPAGATKEELLAAMEGHVLAESVLMGTYSRD